MDLLTLLFVVLFNLGLSMSLIFGGMLLVRPVTNRLLRPRQRALLWYLGWYFMFAFNMFGVLGYLPLHFTFRAFLSPRTNLISYPLPAFLPEYLGPGQYNLALPGNTVVPTVLTDGWMTAAAVIWVIGCVAVSLWSRKRKRVLRDLEQAGEEAVFARFGMGNSSVKAGPFVRVMPKIYLCGGLPTSYVRAGFWGYEYSIYLQRELPPQRMELVLRHELKHLELFHIHYKSVAHIVLILFWWSPLVWLAFRVLCRDMELACDEAVMGDLDENGRREYARTIAELGAGRPLWESAATFGECDAEIRVRQAADWKKAGLLRKALSWSVFALLFVFFYCGSPAGDGTLAADRELEWRWALSQEVTELPMVSHYNFTDMDHLFLVKVWSDPDSNDVYCLDTQGAWWRFQPVYFQGHRQIYAFDLIQLSGEPDLSGLERVK